MKTHHIKAPKINAKTLWNMSAEEFNNWRAKNDYPRIINFLKEKAPNFEKWMSEQEITDEILIEFTPSIFIKERKKIYLYTVINGNQEKEKLVRTENYKKGETFFHEKTVLEKLQVIPYMTWFKKNNPNNEKLNLKITAKVDRSNLFMGELELLDLGNYEIKNLFIGNRNLDFVSLDDLKILYANNNSYLRLYFSSAVNLYVEGDLAFVQAFNTPFYEWWNSKFLSLKLVNGTFQNWSFLNCNIQISASNSSLFRWSIKGSDYNCTLDHSDIRESFFKNGDIKYKQDLGKAKQFHSHVKRLYSQIGKKHEASQHYYLEKTYERKSFYSFKKNFREEYMSVQNGNVFSKINFNLKYSSKYICSYFLNSLWGYGEKPSRIFIMTLVTILIFACIFCYSPNTTHEIKYNFINSLYYSLVTFTTLGASEITQSDSLLKLLSGFEALLGMSFWGILIAGFTNNAKDY